VSRESDAGPDFDAWSLWWQFNQEDYIELRNGAFLPATGDSGLARSSRRAAISEGAARITVFPALLAVLREDPDPWLRSSVLLALARLDGLDGGQQAERRAQLCAALEASSLQVSEAACVGLGLVAEPEVLPVLSALVHDEARGRELVGKKQVSARLRACSTLALGLAAQRSENVDVRRYAVHELVRALEQEGSASSDRRVAALIAVGLVGPGPRGAQPSSTPSASNEALVRRVLALLGDGREDELVRAHAPTALARLLGDVSPELREIAMETLVTGAGPRTRDVRIRQGCLIALGLCADADQDACDREARRALLEHASGGERALQGLALVALAQAGARSAEQGSRATQDELRRFIEKRLARGRSWEQAWAALAQGILLHGCARDEGSAAPDAAQALRRALDDARQPDLAGACAIGAGLAGDPAAGDALRARLDEVHDDDARAHCALGLGFLGTPEAQEPLRALLGEADHRPLLFEQSALALAMLGDPELVPRLIAGVAECDCLTSRAGSYLALGRAGDERALAPLLAAATDRKATSLERAYAAAGLGRLADVGEEPWTARLSIGLNYHARTDSLGGTGGGVLDLP
jgi:HEAT repeat protein